MHDRIYSPDQIAHAVDLVTKVVEESISSAPSAAIAERLFATRAVLQAFRPAFEQSLRTIQIDE